MAAEDFLIAQPSPDSDACILIGRLPVAPVSPVHLGRAVLWIVDEVGAANGHGQLRGTVTVLSVLPITTGQMLEVAINDFIHRIPKHLPSLYVSRGLPPPYEAGYAVAIDTVAACMESHRRARVTRQQDAFVWQRHLFDNIADYMARRLPAQWEAALAGVPAFICGAGPSLDFSIGALAGVAGRGVTFAADSSLRALAACGLQADFAVSVDAAKTPSKCCPDAMLPDRVILSAVSPPEWAGIIPGEKRRYLSSNQVTLEWLASVGVDRTKVEVHENCGATAIELARFLGCSPIYLFGMDLALNEDSTRRHHRAADESLYTNSGFDAGQEFPCVPGNFSPEVLTHVIGDWRALNRRLAALPAGLVRVVTDRGARLSNTMVVRPEEFVLPMMLTPKDALLDAMRAVAPPAAPLKPIADKLDRIGQHLAGWMPFLQEVLEASGPALLVDHLRSFLAVPENAQILGAYSLKLMPHLLPPVVGEATEWKEIIEELGTLGRRAISAATACRD